MSSYNAQQREAFSAVLSGLAALGPGGRARLLAAAGPYMDFRGRVEAFLNRHTADICTTACFTSNLSACCTREGIITFFADAVINALFAAPGDLDALLAQIRRDPPGGKCVYLSPRGCLWKVRPIVCTMFLCDKAEEKIRRDRAEEEWQGLCDERKTFTFPDRSVLFDELEETFLALGLSSELMHLHKSPGLLLVKKKAGLL